MLNIIWVGFFLLAFLSAVYQAVVLGNVEIWTSLVNATFSSAKTAFSISLNLTGVLCLWLGLLKIAEESGLSGFIGKLFYPFFRKVMPDVPKNHPALSSIVMNMAANVLGLDNAATPMGLKAMEQLQELNPKKDEASKAQILFMVINSSAVTLIPITILMYRAELGSINPSAVFIPILLATSISTLVGFLSVAVVEKLNIFNKVVLGYLFSFVLLISSIALYFNYLPSDVRLNASANLGNFILFSIIITFIMAGVIKKQNVYDNFVKGAKEGFDIAIKIIPYLVAMLVAIAVFRSSGVMGALVLGLENMFSFFGFDTAFVSALPTAIMKPLSGSGARAMMIENFNTYGVDSFSAFVSSVIQGSTETTFYVLAVYFGSVKISKVGSALPCSLLADFAGIVSAIYLSYLFY